MVVCMAAERYNGREFFRKGNEGEATRQGVRR